MSEYDLSLLDLIVGMNRYYTREKFIKGGEWRNIDDFIVEEIIEPGYVVSIDNPVLRSSGFPGLFTHFVLIKRNIDLIRATEILSRKWGVSPGLIFFSGFKDKEALTAQRGCVFGVSPKKILEQDYPKNIRIYSPVRELRRVWIGSHWGNRFNIKIWNATIITTELVEEDAKIRMRSINFFGYQRFGIWKPITHIAGKLLLLRRYRAALELFIREINPLFSERDKLLKLLDERKYKQAYELLPKRKFDFEKLALRLLQKYDKDDLVKRIPPQMTRIMLEAYQAFLYNKTLSLLAEVPHKVPIIGHSLDKIMSLSSAEFSPNVQQVINKILEGEGIDYRWFKNKLFKQYIAKGGFRRAILETEIKIENNGEYLELRFDLRKGAFATVVLRELLKEDTLDLLLSRRKNVSKAMKAYYKEILNKYYTSQYFLKADF